jgi:endonuclease/exonuclease/phosphatase family metal-dependent hydrolase
MKLSCWWIVLLLTFTGCMNHPAPKQPWIEWRQPVNGTAADSSRLLRVVTYNVHRISGRALTRAVASADELKDADIILLQEVTKLDGVCSPACELAAYLGMYSMYAPGHGVDGGSDGVAILSKTPLYDAHVIELPSTSVVFNGGRRVALMAHTDYRGVMMQVYAVHLENRISPEVRRAHLMPVLAHAKRDPVAAQMPTVIAGDMNTTPFTWIGHVVPWPAAQGCWLEDLVQSQGFDTPVTDSGPTSPWLSMRLDAIYSRGLQIADYAVANSVRASDHLPLWADFIVTKPTTLQEPK